MAMHSSARPINLAMRALQFFFSLLIMALVGNMIAEATGGNPSIVNYSMFVAVFSMLSLLYLIPVSFNDSWSLHPLLPLLLDALNVLFWFCGAVAFAAELHVDNCADSNYITTNYITNGANDKTKRCREGQASTAFLWFGFFAFVVSAVLTGLQSRGSANMRPGGIRRGPAMSKV